MHIPRSSANVGKLCRFPPSNHRQVEMAFSLWEARGETGAAALSKCSLFVTTYFQCQAIDTRLRPVVFYHWPKHQTIDVYVHIILHFLWNAPIAHIPQCNDPKHASNFKSKQKKKKHTRCDADQRSNDSPFMDYRSVDYFFFQIVAQGCIQWSLSFLHRMSRHILWFQATSPPNTGVVAPISVR